MMRKHTLLECHKMRMYTMWVTVVHTMVSQFDNTWGKLLKNIKRV